MGNESRYLVLTELFLPTKGGTAVWFSEVYRRIGGKGIHIVTADAPGAQEVDAVHPNTIHRLNLRRVPWLRPESLAIYSKFLFRAAALAMTRRFDAIHAGRALPEGLVALIVGRLTFHEVVIYAHGEELTTWGDGTKYRTMRFALRHADTVVANSDYTDQQLRRMGVPAKQIVVVNPGVDIERFRAGLPCADLKDSIGLRRDEHLILSVGRLQRRKGFDMVIRSIPQLLDAGLGVRYALIGIGEDQEYLADLAAKHGVADRVHLLGHVSPADLARWYNACNVFAMPNREVSGDTEGFGMVFLEAAACGKPAIAGNAGGTGAAVLDGETGLRVDGDDIMAIAQSLLRLLSQPDTRENMAQTAVARARRVFSWDRVADRTRLLPSRRSRS